MKLTIRKLTIFVLALLLIAGCSAGGKQPSSDGSGEGSKPTGGKLKVVATYSIIYDLVLNVGGDRVEVVSLAPVGSDPHEYDPLPADVKNTADADAVFYNGMNLEAGNSWFEKLLETTKKTGENAPVFRVSEGVEAKYLTSTGNEGEMDPHAWLNVRNGMKYVENIRDALIQIDPDHETEYKNNAGAYLAELEKLHEEAVDRFNEIPQDKRFLVTSEGAFKYFSEAYGFEAGYIWEINAENQGTPAQVKSIVDLIRNKDVPVLFVETSVDPRSMEMVSKDTGVPIGGQIFTDSLGAPGKDGDTYIKMMKWNIDTIYDGLTKN
ncbi:metal ABC transporter substrate-binding protein [Paenibacillus sp. J2TS4]|uniref:metal ABC transporter substrate-binding protein n=1 Tax=Paenibacillus sp. J2TS4 TaxID=2807194 RepID=UPI001B061049|nr:metal ABC transporter substrate-binding protein [Paenibacillus sp. J2TS4]GIP31520.1 manganese-binding lipoprotein MntA [Paenibacillus sp. J2TS4]